MGLLKVSLTIYQVPDRPSPRRGGTICIHRIVWAQAYLYRIGIPLLLILRYHRGRSISTFNIHLPLHHGITVSHTGNSPGG